MKPPTADDEGCTTNFEEVGGHCVQWMGIRKRYADAVAMCQGLEGVTADLLMLKTEEFTAAILAWDRVSSG